GQILGDDTSGDVVTMVNQSENSVANGNSPTPADTGDGLLSQGYLIPQLMQVQKNLNGEGLDNSVAGQIATGSIVSQANPNFNASLFATYSSGPYAAKLPDLTTLTAVTTGTGSTYGSKGSAFARNFFNGGAITITNNNYVFGNFNQNGVRDYNAIKSALSADRALITADQAVGASVAGSEFTSAGDNNGVAGGTNGILNTAAVSYTDALGVAHSTLTKGDLVVMGDYNGDGHFDGADLVAMAEGAALSDSTGSDRLLTDNYQTGVLDKNAAMDYMNTNVGTTGADLYIRQSGRQILEAASVPAGATAVTNPITSAPVFDPVSGLAEFSYDPNGTNTFNKSDVNQDGVVDMNDAVVVDDANGKDFSNLGDQVGATMPAPVIGGTIPLNLVMAKQSDGSTVIGSSDVAVVNTQLTGTGTTNWYGYNLQKTGPSTITFARTGGAVNVSAGAAFEISNGIVQVGGSVDPFSGTGTTTGNHVSVAVDSGAKLQFTPNAAVSEIAGLSVTGSSVVDLTNNELKIDYAPGTQASADATIRSYLINGFNGGAWNGVGGINSSTAALPANSSFALGYADGADGVVSGLSSGQIEVKFTRYGDANLDGVVSGVDFTILVGNLGKSANSWDQGDFNYDGVVSGTDFTALVSNLGKSANGANVTLPAADLAAIDAFAAANGLMADVPEPASAGLILIACSGMLARRRRMV
ncbi:MAG TPA: dockerin type I domain-containing protein, partial [Tepidisphaeraceae bacterium]